MQSTAQRYTFAHTTPACKLRSHRPSLLKFCRWKRKQEPAAWGWHPAPDGIVSLTQCKQSQDPLWRHHKVRKTQRHTTTTQKNYIVESCHFRQRAFLASNIDGTRCRALLHAPQETGGELWARKKQKQKRKKKEHLRPHQHTTLKYSNVHRRCNKRQLVSAESLGITWQARRRSQHILKTTPAE